MGQTKRTKKAGKAYHHGDLPRAMLTDAVRIIQRRGIDALTLRGVGERLGVSRTALYRHFANKDALLQTVAAEGFRLLQAEVESAWQRAGGGRPGFEAMGTAYVQFAVEHPAHYRVMFGSVVRGTDATGAPGQDTSGGAFSALASAIETLQHDGILRKDDPRQVAQYVWAVMHGVAMLAIDGLLRTSAEVDALKRFASERLRTGIGA